MSSVGWIVVLAFQRERRNADVEGQPVLAFHSECPPHVTRWCLQADVGAVLVHGLLSRKDRELSQNTPSSDRLQRSGQRKHPPIPLSQLNRLFTQIFQANAISPLEETSNYSYDICGFEYFFRFCVILNSF